MQRLDRIQFVSVAFCTQHLNIKDCFECLLFKCSQYLCSISENSWCI